MQTGLDTCRSWVAGSCQQTLTCVFLNCLPSHPSTPPPRSSRFCSCFEAAKVQGLYNTRIIPRSTAAAMDDGIELNFAAPSGGVPAAVKRAAVPKGGRWTDRYDPT